MRSWLADYALPQVREKQSEGFLLQEWQRQWDKYNTLCKLMERLFAYLNRYFLKNQGLKLLG